MMISADDLLRPAFLDRTCLTVAQKHTAQQVTVIRGGEKLMCDASVIGAG